MNEFEFIKQKLSKLSPKNALNNDAFIYRNNTVITKDIIIEGVHFLENTEAYYVAKKAIRVNLSDIAAMGASPYGYLLGLAINDTSERWLNNFIKGLEEDNNQFNIKLLGGDTTKHTGSNIISVTMLGIVENNQFLTRSGATPGDSVYVSGNIGDSAIGLISYNDTRLQEFKNLQEKYKLPNPQIDLGRKLIKTASSCIDISDGLIQDMKHICEESNVGLEISIDRLPFSKEVSKIIKLDQKYLSIALTGGDDYQLLFTSSKDINYENVTKIGIVVHGNQLRIIDQKKTNVNLLKYGYQHF